MPRFTKKLKIFVSVLTFIFLTILVIADNDYNNPLTRSIADRLYCLLTGCTIKGDVIIEGNLTIIGSISNVSTINANGSILPSQDNQFDIGSSTKRWKDGYFSNDLIVAGNIYGEIPDAYKKGNYSAEYASSGFDNENFTGQFAVHNTSTIRFNQSGLNLYPSEITSNVGIGTTGPEKLLTLDQKADNDGIRIYGYDDRSADYVDMYMRSNGYFRIGTGGSRSIEIDVPGGAALFFKQAGTEIMRMQGDQFKLRDDGGFGLGNSGGMSYFAFGYDSSDDDFRIVEGNNLNNNVRMVIENATGNVGIGTTTPTSKLEVIGDANITGTIYANSFVGNVTSYNEEKVTVTVSGGIGGNSSINCCNDNTILQIVAFPTSAANTYFFNVTSVNIVEVIQSNNSLQHTGNWLASYKTTGQAVINYNISGAAIDEDFTIRTRWKR